MGIVDVPCEHDEDDKREEGETHHADEHKPAALVRLRRHRLDDGAAGLVVIVVSCVLKTLSRLVPRIYTCPRLQVRA